MTKIQRSALIPFSNQQMYNLVADVESYPLFLPWCGSARIVSQQGGEVVATVGIDFKGVNKAFTTRNQLISPSSIDMELVDGPFQHLQGGWSFTALDDQASKISFDLQFEFSNRIIRLVVGPVFQQIANGLVDAFHQRAEALYGRG